MDNKDIVENDRVALEDKAGLTEIQDAIQEIEKLKNGGSITTEEIKEEPLQANEDEEKEEDSQEDEDEDEDEEPEEQETISTKEKSKKLDKIWKIKKGYYKEKAEKRQALEEVARLKEMLSQVEVAGTYQYGKNIYTELERAREFANKTATDGDTKGFIDAIGNLVNAQSKVNELEKWANSSENRTVQNPQQQYIPEESYEEIERELVGDWLISHKELQVESKHYNKPLADSVIKYANVLDRELDEIGRPDLRFSEEYFDAIEGYITEYKNKSEKKRKSFDSANHVGGVRNSYSSSTPGKSPQSIQVTLTPEEKKICASSFGRITEKDWLKFKADEQLK